MMNKPAGQQKLIPLAELSSGKPRRIELDSKTVLLCRVNDQVYAVDDQCPHEDISLSLGVMCEYRLRCPLHGSEFDVRTGKVLSEPAESDLETYPVEVEDGWVCLDNST